MSEWFKEHAWKAILARLTESGVNEYSTQGGAVASVRPSPSEFRCAVKAFEIAWSIGQPRRYFLRVSVTFANDDTLPVLSTLSIVHDHVSVVRS
jgi:hypothetical protein